MKKQHELWELPLTTVCCHFWSLTSIWLQWQLLVLYSEIPLLIQVSNDRHPNQEISANCIHQNTTWQTFTHILYSHIQHNTEYTTQDQLWIKSSILTLFLVHNYGTFINGVCFTERRIQEWLSSALHILCNLNIFLLPPRLELLELILYAICSLCKNSISDLRNYTVWERTSLQKKYRIDWTKFQPNYRI